MGSTGEQVVLGTTMWIHVLPVLCVLQLAAVSCLSLAQETDKQCDFTAKCATLASCPYWSQKQHQYQQTKDKQLLSKIKAAVCNKAGKAVCCPDTEIDINPSPTYLPGAGECGLNPNKPPGKIFGGQRTQPGDFPFAALLGRTVARQSHVYCGGARCPPQLVPSWVCGGTLINYWYVVTAGHCIGRGQFKITHLRLGEHTVGGFGSGDGDSKNGLPPLQEFKISQEDITEHEGYKKTLRNIENDIALIRLPRKAKLNIGVQFACLPLPRTEKRVGIKNWSTGAHGSTATVIGWGYSCYENNSREFCKDDNVGNKDQQYLEVPVVENQVCSNRGHELTEDQLCAGGEERKGACEGDSGGGLFLREESEAPWFLLGVVSYGDSACGLGIPDVYTKVSEYIDWIKENLRN